MPQPRRTFCMTSSTIMNCACSHCEKLMHRPPSGIKKTVYCSRACITASKAVQRTCKCCSKVFTTQIGRLSGKTNSSANFCSRPCYETWLCRPNRVNGRGVRWHIISKESVRRSPFCGCCGRRRGRLEVHHITPYRLTRDNAHRNLIPLCPRCHKRVEGLTNDLEDAGVSSETLGWFLSIQLRYRQFQTATILQKLNNEPARATA